MDQQRVDVWIKAFLTTPDNTAADLKDNKQDNAVFLRGKNDKIRKRFYPERYPSFLYLG